MQEFWAECIKTWEPVSIFHLCKPTLHKARCLSQPRERNEPTLHFRWDSVQPASCRTWSTSRHLRPIRWTVANISDIPMTLVNHINCKDSDVIPPLSKTEIEKCFTQKKSLGPFAATPQTFPKRLINQIPPLPCLLRVLMQVDWAIPTLTAQSGFTSGGSFMPKNAMLLPSWELTFSLPKKAAFEDDFSLARLVGYVGF